MPHGQIKKIFYILKKAFICYTQEGIILLQQQR